MKIEKLYEKFMKLIFLISAVVAILSIVLISFYIFKEAFGFIKQYGLVDFVTKTQWKPLDTPAKFGILPMILGSFIVTLGALIIGVPIGILTAIYLKFYADKKTYKIARPAIDLMAGIPSIVYGLFALTVIAPKVREIFGGTGLNIITASILLGIMILPTVTNLSYSSIDAVKNSYYEGAVALGASHERAIFNVVIPTAKSGVISSVILGMSRAIGETMAVALVAGNQPVMPKGLTKGVRTMTTNIVMEMAYATGIHRQSLIATAAILFVFILFINGIFLILKRRDGNG